MIKKFKRFIAFLKKEKTYSFLSLMLYILLVYALANLPSYFPSIFMVIYYIAFTLTSILFLFTYLILKIDKIPNAKENGIKQRAKKILKELLMFIPIWLITFIITSFFMVGQPENQIAINKSFKDAPIILFITAVFVGPICEEWICRFLPYNFIKNKVLYIIISSIVFAALHVIDDPSAFYYIWFYMMRPLYYAYRYHKTRDLLVPISMHMFNNLISTLLMMF